MEIRSPWNLIIKKGAIIGDKCVLDARSGLIIGESANLSSEVNIWTLQHDMHDLKFCGKGAPVFIGKRAWLSTRTIILPGVDIGEGSVVAAGCIVTKSTAPFTVNAGIPNRCVGTRNKLIDYDWNGQGYNRFL